MSKSGPTVSAVVVHYRGGEHLRRCLEACLASERMLEVLVVDNEGVGARLRAEHPDPRVRVVHMRRNVGYGTAANVGSSLARGDAVLVMNQDVVMPAATLDRMLEAGEEAGAWIVGPRYHDASGRESGRKSGFPWPLPWVAPRPPADGWRPTAFVTGAVMLFMPGHTDLRFDERFFMYGEEEDICWRVWSEGGVVIALEDVWALHVGATSTSTRWTPRMTAYRIVLGRARVVRKHAGWWGLVRYWARWLSSVARAKLRRAQAR